MATAKKKPGNEFELETAPDTVLFPDGLFLRVPDVGRFRLLDRANPPREDEVNPETKPVSYIVEYLSRQVVEEERDEFRDGILAALDDNRIMVGTLPRAARWIVEARAEAERTAVSAEAGRPTTGRSRSRS